MKHEFLYDVEREVNHPIEKLWAAFTESDQLGVWYHPVGLTIPAGTAVSEPRVGGKWSVAVQAPGDETVHYFFGSYREVVEHQTLEHSMHYTNDSALFESFDETTPFHIVKIKFEKRVDKSYVHWSQYGELPEGHAEMAKAGMSSYFDSLEEFLGN